MSSCYLCDTCKRNLGVPSIEGVRQYGACDCEIDGEMAMLVMHDGIERPTDLCEHYAPKGGDRRGQGC